MWHAHALIGMDFGSGRHSNPIPKAVGLQSHGFRRTSKQSEGLTPTEPPRIPGRSGHTLLHVRRPASH